LPPETTPSALLKAIDVEQYKFILVTYTVDHDLFSNIILRSLGEGIGQLE